jgi:putative transposase
MDFVSDQLVGGTRLRAFNVVDDFTRECLAIEVDTSIPGLRATRVLERIAAARPLPKYLICDNGPEFTGCRSPQFDPTW